MVGNGVVSVLILLVTAFLAFVVWIELALRAAMVYLLAAFIPLVAMLTCAVMTLRADS